jgi:hypothetical protein
MLLLTLLIFIVRATQSQLISSYTVGKIGKRVLIVPGLNERYLDPITGQLFLLAV